MKQYTAITTNDKHSEGGYSRINFVASDETEARHWIINHLDLSLNWTVLQFSNKVNKFKPSEETNI